MWNSSIFGYSVWGLAIVLAGLLAERSSRLARFPALRIYFWFAFASQPIMLLLYDCCNTFYGRYWYALNAYEVVETFLLTVVLAEMFGEARRGIVAGVVLALPAILPASDLLAATQAVLCFLACLEAFIQDERGHIVQGVLALLVFPLIASQPFVPKWMAFVSTVSAVIAQCLWLYAMKVSIKTRT